MCKYILEPSLDLLWCVLKESRDSLTGNISKETIGPILDERLKEELVKPWKGAHSSHFRVCPSVLNRATEHIFWHRNLIFGLRDPWDMRKKCIYLFFEICIFTLFIGIFRFFPYTTLVFCFVFNHSFSPRDVIFGFIVPFTIRK